MSTNPSSSVQLPSPGTTVHGNRLADDKAIADEFSDVLTGVGIGDFVDFVGVEPDLTLTATDDGGREALLSAEVDPVAITMSVIERFLLILKTLVVVVCVFRRDGIRGVTRVYWCRMMLILDEDGHVLAFEEADGDGTHIFAPVVDEVVVVGREVEMDVWMMRRLIGILSKWDRSGR